MKKLIAIIGIGLALCATASTQTSKEYVDKKDAEVLERAKTFTEEHVIDFEDWTRSEIGKIEETADQANTNANLALEKSSRASEDAERAVKNMYHGSARPLPPYLHAIDFDDTYPDDAAWYYALPHDYSGCSAVRDGGFLYRNYDWRLDDAAEFVVRMSAGVGRFASIGVANCGTNLTEQIVTSGKWSRFYRCLPGRTVDGINENGVVCEINVVDTDPPESSGGDIHPLAAVRWALDNGTSAEMVATNLAVRVMWPSGWRQNFHWMIADAAETWIVENGVASNVTEVAAKLVMTNFEILPDTYSGMGKERYNLLLSSACCITNAWYTRAYRRETNPTWVSDLAEVIAYTNDIFTAWAAHPKEYFRGQLNGGKPWWQTVHTSIYNITNKTLRVAVQEIDDWYTFAVPSAGGVKPETVREIVSPMIADATNYTDRATGEVIRLVGALADEVSRSVGTLADTKRDKTDLSYGEDIAEWTPGVVYWQGTTNVYYDSVTYTDGLWQCVLQYGPGRGDLVPMGGDTFDAEATELIFPQGTVTHLVRRTADSLALVSQLQPPGNYEAVSNAAVNSIQHIADTNANLIFTITGEGRRFYFTPIRAINPED